MKKKLLAVILVLMLLVASGCGAKSEEVKTLTLHSLTEKTNKEDEAFIKRETTYDEAEYLRDYEDINFSDEEIKSLGEADYNSVTKDQAKEDVDMLMRLLKSKYAGYTYFGGDEAFNKAKEEIYANIDSYSKEKINQEAFTDMMKEPLSFVIDSHFQIGMDQCFPEANTYYEASQMEFYETESGFFTLIDEKRYYIPEDFEKYLKVTIADSGELVYGMFAVVITDEKDKLPTQLELSCGLKKKSVELEWILSEVGGDQITHSEYTEVNSVAISSLSDMVATEYNFPLMNDFLNNSKKHAEHEYSILDLRYNNGGVAQIDTLWIYGYTGEITDVTYPQICISDEFYEKYIEDFGDDRNIELYSQFDLADENFKTEVLENELPFGINKTDGLIGAKPEKMIENPNTLFVLQSKRDFSAGEAFIMMLDTVENTLSVGTNTNGCIHLGDVFNIYLPNSGLPVVYSLSIFPGFEKDFEIYGIEPDIYIADADAQEEVLRCIEYYREK